MREGRKVAFVVFDEEERKLFFKTKVGTFIFSFEEIVVLTWIRSFILRQHKYND